MTKTLETPKAKTMTLPSLTSQDIPDQAYDHRYSVTFRVSFPENIHSTNERIQFLLNAGERGKCSISETVGDQISFFMILHHQVNREKIENLQRIIQHKLHLAVLERQFRIHPYLYNMTSEESP